MIPLIPLVAAAAAAATALAWVSNRGQRKAEKVKALAPNQARKPQKGK